MEKSSETTRSPAAASPAAASLAALGSVILASSCCLPVLPFVAAAGAAGASTFLIAARPYLLGCAVLSIGYGFYQARHARQCNARPSALASYTLWASAVLVGLSIFFPQILADLAATFLG